MYLGKSKARMKMNDHLAWRIIIFLYCRMQFLGEARRIFLSSFPSLGFRLPCWLPWFPLPALPLPSSLPFCGAWFPSCPCSPFPVPSSLPLPSPLPCPRPFPALCWNAFKYIFYTSVFVVGCYVLEYEGQWQDHPVFQNLWTLGSSVGARSAL